ncbi:hypothetical protein ACFFJX_26140 [Pseudarcicella hirudinis]
MEKILVIDDDTDICLLLKRFLTKNNYEVEIAHNGKAVWLFWMNFVRIWS